MDEGTDIFQMIVSVVEAVIALANLIVIIYFTRVERKEKLEREKEEINERKKERTFEIQQNRKEIIYSKIVAGRLCNIVEEYFDDCLRMVNSIECANYQERDALIEAVTDEFQKKRSSFKNIILPILDALNEDEYNKVKRYLEEHQDKMIEAFSKGQKIWYREKQHIEKIRVQILKGLLQMDIEVCEKE